jgi:hypothetical protein
MTDPADIESQLADDLARFTHDPSGWVLWAFPWGEAGTELAGESGPRAWQVAMLEHVGQRLREGAIVAEAVAEAIQLAVSSGHGIGKSALVSWLILWALSTHEDTRGVVTANTDRQLTTKTWPEVAKWHRLMLCAHWFKFTATAIFSAEEAHEKTWRVDAIPWNERAPEAFAGLHNKGHRILVIFDEASSIPDVIWETVEGALTDERTEIVFACFGNPTRNTGRFRECFGSRGHRWHHQQIDSRTVVGTNKVQIQKWIDDYGEDSDFVRVRVRGIFPKAGSMQFIPSDVVEAAARVEPNPTIYDAVVLGVDVARFGDDESVIVVRRGRDARTWPTLTFRGVDTMTLAGRVTEIASQQGADAIFVDETGIGGAVVDRCRQLGFRVFGVNNGAVSDVPVEGELVANKGAECWARGRQWLKTGGAIRDDAELRTQLESREYGYNAHNEIRLESKPDMKARGLSSPDRADALMLTFAYPVAAKSDTAARGSGQSVTDFDPYTTH